LEFYYVHDDVHALHHHHCVCESECEKQCQCCHGGVDLLERIYLNVLAAPSNYRLLAKRHCSAGKHIEKWRKELANIFA
tara:strand:- start:110431 stop:110667 length:237 start_codon:yes stop_codon:yes gene_type:complete